ncbi:MAG: peptidylprolyl isomerase [Raineya sp.]|nr:peptidylprolyl isomerase [Raineya sp.]
MQVAKDKVVFITYTITSLDDQMVIEHVPTSTPYGFLCGNHFVLPAMEEKLLGLSVGDSFDFILTPQEAFGDYDEEGVMQYSIEEFLENGFPQEMLKVGEIVPLQDEEGFPVDAVITEIDDEFVTLDFNHPLAGRTLHYQGKILDIRDATPEEIMQGVVKSIQ